MLARCRQVENPLIRLGLFRANNFRWGNAAMLIHACGFSAMFLGNVLFLTRVWGYSILTAGLAISIGPVIVAATAPMFGRLAGRVGQRRLLVPGGLIWALGGVLLLARATTTPQYLTVYLPSGICTALGVSLVLPQLSSVSVPGLPADQFGAGSAVVQAVRYMGSTLGVALVAAFTSGAAGDSIAGFQHLWWLLALCGVVVSALSTRLARPAAAPIEARMAATAAHARVANPPSRNLAASRSALPYGWTMSSSRLAKEIQERWWRG